MLNLTNLKLLQSTFDELINYPLAYPVSFAKTTDWTRKCPFTWCMYMHEKQFGVMGDITISRFFVQIVDGDVPCPFGLERHQFECLFGARAIHTHTWSQIGSHKNRDFDQRAIMAELHARRRYLEDLLAVALQADCQPPESATPVDAISLAQ